MTKQLEHKILTAVKQCMNQIPIAGMFQENSDNFILTLSKDEMLSMLERQNDLQITLSLLNEQENKYENQ